MAERNDAVHSYDVPIGQIIQSVAQAIVQAQSALDANALRSAERMSGFEVVRDEHGKPVLDDAGNPLKVDHLVHFGGTGLSMMELGFTPTFYQFAETNVELRLALRATRSDDAHGETTYDMRGTPVDATYQSHFGYDLDGSCVVKTKLVPVPAPPLLEQRIRVLLEEERRHAGLNPSKESEE